MEKIIEQASISKVARIANVGEIWQETRLHLSNKLITLLTIHNFTHIREM